MLTTKQTVLKILEENKGKSVSGSEISKHAKVTRSAVWKAVNDLRQDGYIIEAITNKGYRLAKENSILSAEGIAPYLLDNSYTITVYDTVESTNTLLKQQAAKGACDKTVIIANEQTAGRGRRGNSFFSPKDSGLYISILLRPKNIKATDAPIITTATAVAVCNAVSKSYNIELSIKWINDLFYNDKKVCGILTEASTNFETGYVDYIVIGIGINLNIPKDGFPNELTEIAGAISDTDIDKNFFTATLLNELDLIMSTLATRSFLEQYKTRLFVLGKPIEVITPTNSYSAVAVDINDNAELIVKCDNGELHTLNSGEIRIRKG